MTADGSDDDLTYPDGLLEGLLAEAGRWDIDLVRGWYVLDYETKQTRPARNIEEYRSAWDDPRRILAQDHMQDGWWISTIFLALDHSHSSIPGAAPVLFETMIFDGTSYADHWTDRYETYDQAMAMHTKMTVKMLDGWRPGDDDGDEE